MLPYCFVVNTGNSLSSDQCWWVIGIWNGTNLTSFLVWFSLIPINQLNSQRKYQSALLCPLLSGFYKWSGCNYPNSLEASCQHLSGWHRDNVLADEQLFLYVWLTVCYKKPTENNCLSVPCQSVMEHLNIIYEMVKNVKYVKKLHK